LQAFIHELRNRQLRATTGVEEAGWRAARKLEKLTPPDALRRQQDRLAADLAGYVEARARWTVHVDFNEPTRTSLAHVVGQTPLRLQVVFDASKTRASKARSGGPDFRAN
jgi:hypothetical protein